MSSLVKYIDYLTNSPNSHAKESCGQQQKLGSLSVPYMYGETFACERGCSFPLDNRLF